MPAAPIDRNFITTLLEAMVRTESINPDLAPGGSGEGERPPGSASGSTRSASMSPSRTSLRAAPMSLRAGPGAARRPR